MQRYKKTLLLLGFTALIGGLSACHQSDPNKYPETPQTPTVQEGPSYPDADVFTKLIPYPMVQWGATEQEIKDWETAHGGTLNEQKSQEYSTENDKILWFDVKRSTANPVRGYYLSGREYKLSQALGYYAPLSLILNEDCTQLTPEVDDFLVKNMYEFIGLSLGYFTYTSSYHKIILKIASVEHNGMDLAIVNYCPKP